MNVIELAKEAGFEPNSSYTVLPMHDYASHGISRQLKYFAALVRKETLEEAAKVCRTAQAQGLQSIREAIEEAIRGLK